MLSDENLLDVVLIFDQHPTTLGNLLRHFESRAELIIACIPSHIDKSLLKSSLTNIQIEEMNAAPELEGMQSGVRQYYAKLTWTIKEALRARFLIKRYNPKVVIVGAFTPGWLLLGVPRNIRKLYFLESLIEGSWAKYLGWIWGWCIRIFKFQIVVNSQVAARRLELHWKIRAKSKYVYVFPLASNIVSNYQVKANQSRQKKLMQVAGLHWFKDPLSYVNMAAILRYEFGFSNLSFELIGTGPLEPELLTVIDELNLGHCFRILRDQSQQQIADRLRESTVYVQTSLLDNFPISVIDALSHGIPCVVTDVGGLPELVDDSVTGFVVPASDSRAAALKVSLLLHDEVLRRRMSSAAVESARKKYSPAVFDSNLDRLLREMG